MVFQMVLGIFGNPVNVYQLENFKQVRQFGSKYL